MVIATIKLIVKILHVTVITLTRTIHQCEYITTSFIHNRLEVRFVKIRIRTIESDSWPCNIIVAPREGGKASKSTQNQDDLIQGKEEILLHHEFLLVHSSPLQRFQRVKWIFNDLIVGNDCEKILKVLKELGEKLAVSEAKEAVDDLLKRRTLYLLDFICAFKP